MESLRPVVNRDLQRHGDQGLPFARSALARGLAFYGGWLLLADPRLPVTPVLLADLAAGVPAAAAATWASLRLLPPTAGRIRYGALVRLVWRLLSQSVVSGIDVARRTLSPRLSLQPGYLTYPTRLPPGPGRAVFGALTGLMPGTLPVGTDAAGRLVYHCLDVMQPVAESLAIDETLLLQVLGQDDGHR
ncbi:Na+/H+ antiporter subunit E [Allochromatium humboldtianum]|uniref:Na+/H+ antiporter subunit E n=1 Tax=Allochromatium humboldtianum TaxID=504901 RepID=A0A850RCJ3_9GAMM|nr:Na+/H+ antiporter subunit E [Allochromatium humboldtianum]